MTDARRWLSSPVESGAAAGFGVYLHVPFCQHRCGYCDFATAAVSDRSSDEVGRLYDRYLTALQDDLGRQVAGSPRPAAPAERHTAPGSHGEADEPWRSVTSIFVGGGTPTLLGGERLARLVEAVRRELDVRADAEVTVECNPETASPALFEALAAAGVTRVSIGAQSFVPHVLRVLERRHGADLPVEVARQARDAGIGAVNLDVIYGTPGESDADWRATLEGLLAARVEHISAYALTIHDNTPFGRAVSAGRLPQVDEDLQRDRFDVARELLVAGGFEHYEVSNWALGTSRRSHHNQLYWRHGDYLGVGVGAHGHLSGWRRWSTRSTERYLAAVEAGADPIAGSELLSDEERAEERLLLGLRLREGIDAHDLPELAVGAVDRLEELGLIDTSGGRLRCSERGWFLLDEVVARLAA